MNYLSASKSILLIAGDILISMLSVYSGAYLRLNVYPLELNKYYPLMPKAVLFAVLIVIIYFFVDLYEKGNIIKGTAC